MFQENYFLAIKNFYFTSMFGDPRTYGTLDTFHAGQDLASCLGKNQDIHNIIAGQVFNYGKDKYAGRNITIQHNLKFIGGPNDRFFSCYKHLYSIEKKVKATSQKNSENNFIPPGEIIGKMGNSGYCMTKSKITKKWRLLTQAEKSDPKCKLGVHVHWELYQITRDGMTTPLIQELTREGFVQNEPFYYFFRNDHLYINPNVILNYIVYLRNKNKKNEYAGMIF